MPNKRRKNNQERHNQISAHQKKTVDERRKREAKGGLFTKAVPPFRANNRKSGAEDENRLGGLVGIGDKARYRG